LFSESSTAGTNPTPIINSDDHADGRSLKLGMEPDCTNRNRSAVAVVSGVNDELIVEHDPPGVNWKLVIGLDYLLQSRVWQLTITNENAQPSLIEKFGMDGGNCVRDGGKSNCIVRPSPPLASER